MKLLIQTPNAVIVNETVSKVVAEAENGHFCLLPRHIDFLAALIPGILEFHDEDPVDRNGTENGEHFVAVGEGLLVKFGDTVFVSVRDAVRGADLGDLDRTVREQFSAIDDREKAAHAAIAKLEASFLRGSIELTGDSR